ncbi:MAG: hypothetical protein ACFFG0_02680 [Candidatus Thorarchaeota archaeon]
MKNKTSLKYLEKLFNEVSSEPRYLLLPYDEQLIEILLQHGFKIKEVEGFDTLCLIDTLPDKPPSKPSSDVF